VINESTVLVLGAGASSPYGFPLGATLVERIVFETSGNGHTLFRQLRDCGEEPGTILSLGKALHLSGQPSIDAFLERRPDLLRVGKLAIAAALMPYEDHDKLLTNTGSNGFVI
jgi:hypothetical protein